MDDFPAHVAERFHDNNQDNADAASISTDGSEVSVVDGEILMRAPKEQFRLGYFDVMCLVVNRMIGESTRTIAAGMFCFSVEKVCVEVEFALITIAL